MTIKNNKGNERSFKLLLKVEKEENCYLVYQDIITSKIYSGRKVKDKLIPLTDKEELYINNLLERVKG